MATTKPRASQIRGLARQQAPFLADLIPDSNLPNTTSNYVLKGAFFTPDMTVSVEGQTVDIFNFISDNEVRIVVTHGSAEGQFDVTLNNGKESVFENALLIVNGDVFIPQSDEWTVLSSNPTLDQPGAVKVPNLTNYHEARWQTIIDKDDEFSFYWNFRRPDFVVDTYRSGGYPGIKIIDSMTEDVLYEIQNDRNYLARLFENGNAVSQYSDGYNNMDLFLSRTLRLGYIGGFWRFFVNDVQSYQFANNQILPNDLKIIVNAYQTDIENFKYVRHTDN